MPHTNAQACRAGHKEYVHATLFGFVATRDPTDKVLAALLLVLLTPWAFGRAGRRWRLPAAALAVGAAAVVFWMTSTLTLLNQRGACVLYANETLVEQPVEIGYLTLRHTEQATAFLERAPRPFFLHLAYPNAHTALFAMDSSVGRSAHGAYGDNVEEMDWSIGVVLDKLDALGETDNSIVYFASGAPRPLAPP